MKKRFPDKQITSILHAARTVWHCGLYNRVSQQYGRFPDKCLNENGFSDIGHTRKGINE